MGEKGEARKIIATNREARHRYEITDVYEAGIELQGTEVKSLRESKVVMSDAYVYVKNGEAFLSNMHINEYAFGNRENHEPLRTRKLLMHKAEISQLASAIQEKGRAVIPLCLYFKKGRAKVELGVGRGKKLHDKREASKEKDVKRQMAKAMKIAKR